MRVAAVQYRATKGDLDRSRGTLVRLAAMALAMTVAEGRELLRLAELRHRKLLRAHTNLYKAPGRWLLSYPAIAGMLRHGGYAGGVGFGAVVGVVL